MTLRALVEVHKPRAFFLIRYGLSGLAGGLTQTVVLYVWVTVLGFTDTYLWGLVLGFMAALALSFMLQKFWAFRDRESKRSPQQFFSYTAVALSGLALNALLLALAKDLFDASGVDFFGGWYVFVQLVIVGIVSLFNFCMNFLFTFRHARRNGSWKGTSLHPGE
jgi:putative flippase GtrA